MKKLYSLIAVLFFYCATLYGQAPVITVSPTAYNENLGTGTSKKVTVTILNNGDRDLNWEFNGAMVSFVKPDFANYTLPAYQDKISDNLWLTRAESQGLFNIKLESFYDRDNHTSPMGTEWAEGSLSDPTLKVYSTWRNTIGSVGDNILKNIFTMHSIADNQYYDFKWESWTTNGDGGGMSYKRYHVYPWLKPVLSSGKILPFNTFNLEIDLDVSSLAPGIYNVKMYVYSNDPLHSSVEIPFSITVSNAPYIYTSTTSVNYGKRSHGGNYSNPVKIENKGTQPLTISNVVSSNPAFTVTETTFVVQPQESHLLDVVFSPTEIKAYNGELTITSNSLGNSSITIPLSGIGAGAPNISISPVTFDETIVIGQTTTKTITIQNSGNYDLVWKATINPKVKSKVTFTKSDYADYTLPANQDFISPYTIITRANNHGVYNYTSEPYYNSLISPAGTLWAFGNSGEVLPENYFNWEKAVHANPPDMVGKPMTVYLENEKRYIDLTFNAWTSNSNGGGFSYTRDYVVNYLFLPSFEGTVAPISSSNLDITVDATHVFGGVYEATIELSSNDPDQQKILIPFKLTVTGGIPAISANAIDFGTIFTNESKTIDLEVVNNGSADLNISSFASSSADFVVATKEIVIKPTEKSIIPVVFTPSSEGLKSGVLTINSDDPVNSAFSVNLNGTGALPSIAGISPANLDISVEAGLSNTAQISIINTGTSDLNWSVMLSPVKTGGDVVFTKANFADFTLPNNQDKISDDVILTRKDNKGLFNIAQEKEYQDYFSPQGTLWANDSAANRPLASYTNWRNVVRTWGIMDEMIGKPLSIYLQSQDKYLDITFQEWTAENSGGGFSYTRDAVPFKWNYLSPDLYSGTTLSGVPSTVTITANATNLLPGEYNAYATITTNDPTNKSVAIPIKVTVTAGKPAINVNPIDFGISSTGIPKTLDLEVYNNGFGLLTITDFSSSSTAFAVSSQAMSIEPHKTAKIQVTYTPGVGLETAVLTFNSNDPVNPAFAVNLSGTGAEAPQLVVDSTPIERTLTAGATEVISLSLLNDGEISIEGSIDVTQSTPVHFEKFPFVDWNLSANQDKITDHVWITRENVRGLFNIKAETGYDQNTWYSPKGTLWAYGKTSGHTLGDYTSWRNAVYPPNGSIGKTYSMYDVVEKRFFDITFEDWSQNDGGGFAYRRVEVPYWVTNITELTPILGGTSQSVNFTLNATNLVAGVYNTSVYIKTNDIERPEIVIPVTLTVTGTPSINVPASIAFESQPVGGTQTLNLKIENIGTDVLNISSISNTSGAFIISTTPFSINPGTSYNLPVKFAPTESVLYSDVLTLTTSDPINSIVNVTLSGEGTQLPIIEVTGIPINEKILNNGSKSVKIFIKNRGAQELNWKIEGQSLTFTKQNNADYTQAVNQDRITDNVWITRKSSQALFNIKTESGYTGTSPQGTLWTYGNTADVSLSDYKTWFLAINGDPQSMIGKDMSLYLVNDEKYFDLKFNSYAGGGTGGGFSYTRKEILPDWITFNLPSGNIHAAEDTTITVTLNGIGLNGNYSTNFDIVSNDPVNPRIPVSVSITVGGIVVVNPVADIRQNQGSYSYYLDVSSVFESKTPITILPFSDNPDVATVSISSTMVKINKVGPGVAHISLRAADNNSNVAFDDFSFTVNSGPVVANPVPDVNINQGFGSSDIDLTNVFTDINGDAILLSAYSNNSAVATVAVNGNILKVTEMSHGTATITVSARDGYYPTSTVDNFNFRINAIPTVANPLLGFTGIQGFIAKSIDLLNVFADADADKLTYTVTSSNVGVVTASISSRTLIISEVGLGVSTITVTANDGWGGTVSNVFNFTVNIGAGIAELDNTIISLFPNPTTGKLTVKLGDSLKDNVFIHVYSVIGVEVYKQDISNANGLVHLDLSSFGKGVYFIQVAEGSKVISTSKVIYE
jgi:hypothetical protein